MDIKKLIDSIKKHSGFSEVGMIASHLGVVRRTSLNGRKVTGIEVHFNQEEINKIVDEIKSMPGVTEVLVDVCEGRLDVGEEIMAVVVGGDTRENVFPALMAAVDRIKSRGSKKKEFYS